MIIKTVLKDYAKGSAKNSPKAKSISPTSFAAKLPLTLSSNYITEARDYVFHIKAGNINGVEPGVVDSDPVCSQIYREMMGGSNGGGNRNNEEGEENCSERSLLYSMNDSFNVNQTRENQRQSSGNQ
jgi:hypothetical protein